MRFASDLVHALSAIVPGLPMTFAGAADRALQSRDPGDHLAVWLARHTAGLACTIILDDVHNGDECVTSFIGSAVRELPASCRWIIASYRIDDQFPVTLWIASELAALPLETMTLDLTLDEAQDLAEHIRPALPNDVVTALHGATGGRVADFAYVLMANSDETSAERVAQKAFDALSRLEQVLMFKLSLATSLSPEILRCIGGLGRQSATAVLRSLRREHRAIFEPGGKALHSRFAAYVTSRLRSLSPQRRTYIVVRVAEALESCGDVVDAMHLLLTVRYRPGLVRVLERHGLTTVYRANVSIVPDALAVIGGDDRGNAVVLALQAMAASDRGETDVSEAFFLNAGGLASSDEQRAIVLYLYALELVRRGRADAVDLLKPFEPDDLAQIPLSLQALTASLRAVAYVRASAAPALVNAAIREALQLASSTPDPMVSARVYHQAAWIALQRGDAAEATRYGSEAATIAEEAGAYDAASAASTVLYETAADLRDDVSEAASHLSRVALNSARCNNIEMQLFAAVGKFELAMERGDDGDAVAAQAELASFDLQYSSHIVSEAFLAAQVLRATWAGDFRRAYATLASSADLQWTADRSALRWAEIATYATAAGLTDVGRRAAISALRKLRGAPPSLRGTRARILCSLAYSLLGRRTQARAILARACACDDRMSARLEQLAIAVDHVASFHSGAANYGEVIMAIDRLHQHNFGGLARMLEALPTPRLRIAAAAAS